MFKSLFKHIGIGSSHEVWLVKDPELPQLWCRPQYGVGCDCGAGSAVSEFAAAVTGSYSDCMMCTDSDVG